ncbi:MAG: SusE domain-containing protein [Pricia sp.]
MKTIKLATLLLCGIWAVSCSTDDVEDRPVIEAIDAPVLDAPSEGSVYTLEVDNQGELAERFVWSDANFGGDVEITYSVQIDTVGNDFANAETLGSVNSENQLAVTVETFNTAALALGAEPFSATPFEVRVRASAGSMEMFSNVTTLTLSAYTTEAPRIFVVGSFLNASGYGDDWTPASAVPLAASGFGETDFEGFVNIAVDGAQLKFLPSNESFDGDYGDTGDSDGSYSETIEQEEEVNAGTPDGTAGYYLVNVDTEALTYSLQSTSWAVTGAATPNGWPGDDPVATADQDMTYDPETQTWFIDLDLTAGPYKFRANDAWDLNIGTDEDGDGSLNFGGPDFSVDADGNYRIVLDLSNPRAYTSSITLN